MPAIHPIEGRWRPFKAELDGDAAPDIALQAMRFALRAGEYSVRFAGDIHDRGRYELLSADTPAALILHCTHGANRGRKIPAIFQLAGDRLRICYGLDGNRPATFATAAGGQRYLVTYRRDA